MTKRVKRNYERIGLERFNPDNPRHRRILEKRNYYRQQMRQGIPLYEFTELFFTCSCCGECLQLPMVPGFTNCHTCGQYFKVGKNKIRECNEPANWQPQDPAQLNILDQIQEPP